MIIYPLYCNHLTIDIRLYTDYSFNINHIVSLVILTSLATDKDEYQ